MSIHRCRWSFAFCLKKYTFVDWRQAVFMDRLEDIASY